MCAQPRALPEPSASPRRGLRRRLLDPLEDRSDALAAADAHGHERVALLRALELVERLHGQDRAGRADRMAQRDRAAVGVDLGRSRPRSLVTAIACTANASFDSMTSMSEGLRPAFSNARFTAGIGPSPISCGSTPACA